MATLWCWATSSECSASSTALLAQRAHACLAGSDYPDEVSALQPLLRHPGLVNVLRRLPAEQRFTHFFAKESQYTQLDYILLSRSLASTNPQPPFVDRRGALSLCSLRVSSCVCSLTH
jgi:hypothetical protein